SPCLPRTREEAGRRMLWMIHRSLTRRMLRIGCPASLHDVISRTRGMALKTTALLIALRRSRSGAFDGDRHKRAAIAIIAIIDDRSVLQSCDSLADDGRGQKEPLARPDLLAEAVGDLDVEPGGGEKIMQQVLKPDPVDIVERVRSHRMHRRHQERRI